MRTKVPRLLLHLLGLCLPFLCLSAQANAAPIIKVTQAWDGAVVPKNSTVTYTPNVAAGASDSRQFTITNTGNATLTINNPTTLVSGTGFSLIANPPSSLAPNASGTFRVRILSNNGGTYTGTVSISSNDTLNNPYTFTVKATVNPPPAPVISVLQGATAVPKGSTFVYPSSTPARYGLPVIFTIRNTGAAALSISNPAALLAGSGPFGLTVSAPSSIPAGGSGEFRVRLLGSVPGTYTDMVTINSNDPANPSYSFTVQGTITPSSKVGVNQGATAVGNGGLFDFASTPIGLAKPFQFTITNTGSATLTISNPASLLTGSSAFNLTSAAPTSIPVGGSGTFTVRLLSATAGTYSGTVTINSNDPVTPSFGFTVQGTVSPAPVISVVQGTTAVTKGSTFVYPSSTPARYGLPVIFTIRNTGAVALNISNPTTLVSGTGPFGLTVSAPSSIAAGGSGEFRVRLLGSVPGTYTATVTINSDDPANPSYSFTVQGTITPSSKVGVNQGTTAIMDGGTFSFASTPAGVAESLQFSITNTGSATLSISNPASLLTGNSAFSLSSAAPASIPVGGSGTFTIRLLSATPGSYTGTVTINSNDPVTPSFVLTVQGTVGAAPAIRVQCGSTLLTPGATFTFPTTPAGVAATISCTITNTGSAPLAIINPGTILIGSSSFSLVSAPPASIPAGGGGSFTLRLLSSTPGTYTGTVTINSNDPVTPSFSFNIQGTVGTTPAITIQQGSTPIANGSTFSYPSTTVGVPVSVLFTASNTGTAPLSISGITLSGSSAFSLITPIPPPIAPGGSDVFRIRLLSATAGSYAATVTITSNDPLRSPLTFNLQGTVVNGTAAVTVTDPNGAPASATNPYRMKYDFACKNPPVPAETQKVVFKVTNSGTALLTLGSPTFVRRQGGGTFSVSLSANSLDLNSTADLTVSFNGCHTGWGEDFQIAEITLPTNAPSGASVFDVSILWEMRTPDQGLRELDSLMQNGKTAGLCAWQEKLHTDPENPYGPPGASENLPVVAAAIALWSDPSYNGTDYQEWWRIYLAKQLSSPGSPAQNSADYFQGSELMAWDYSVKNVASVAAVRTWTYTGEAGAGAESIHDEAVRYLRATVGFYALAAGQGPARIAYGITEGSVPDPTKTYSFEGNGQPFVNGPYLALAGERSASGFWSDDSRAHAFCRALEIDCSAPDGTDHEQTWEAAVFADAAALLPAAAGSNAFGLTASERDSLKDFINEDGGVINPTLAASLVTGIRTFTRIDFLGWPGVRATCIDSDTNGNTLPTLAAAYWFTPNLGPGQEVQFHYPYLSERGRDGGRGGTCTVDLPNHLLRGFALVDEPDGQGGTMTVEHRPLIALPQASPTFHYKLDQQGFAPVP